VVPFNRLASKIAAVQTDDASVVSKATAALDAASAAQAPADPLAGLQGVLFSGPLQIPAATTLVATQAQSIQSAVKAEAPTASPATLSAWSTELASLTQKLNQVEKAATGVDPSAPPAGWSEPANFQAARTLLTSLQANVSQAQAAQGLVALAAQPAGTAASAAVQALQAAGLKFLPSQPKGQATSRLLGSAAEGAKTGLAASAKATASGVSPGISTGTTDDLTEASDATFKTTAPVVQSQASKAQIAQAQGAQVQAAKAEAAQPDAVQGPPVPVRAAQVAGAAETASAADSTAAAAGGAGTLTDATHVRDLQAHAPSIQPNGAATPTASAAVGAATTVRNEAADAQAKASAIVQVQADATASAATSAQSSPLASPLTTTATTQGPTGAATGAPPAAVAYLSSEIVKQASGKTTSFNIELHPADLGKVDVKLQIQADGQLAARMSFDNPAAAASFQANADSLRQSLQQAGFHVNGDALTFTSGGGQGAADSGAGGFTGQGSSQNGARAFAGAQVAASLAASTSADPLSDPFQARQALGLDMRI
jgi:hypothetical protein